MSLIVGCEEVVKKIEEIYPDFVRNITKKANKKPLTKGQRF